MWKKKRSRQAVSEVISTVLLLGIAVSLFGFLNYIVFSFSSGEPTPSVSLVGTIDMDRNLILIEHYGGQCLDVNTDVVITVGSSHYQRRVWEILLDTNHDNQWNFGEKVQMFIPEGLTDKYVHAMVVDPLSNTLLLAIVLQQAR
jgi:FlaG/FlaF family flagellin (archaellin)